MFGPGGALWALLTNEAPKHRNELNNPRQKIIGGTKYLVIRFLLLYTFLQIYLSNLNWLF